VTVVVSTLTSSDSLLALASLAVTVILLAVVVMLSIKLRKVVSAQSAVLGEQGAQDLVQCVAELQSSFTDLQNEVGISADSLNQRLEAAEKHLSRAIDRSGLCRYDAYGEMSGKQSSSVVWLDSLGNGVVLSTIVHRDQARVYVKPIRNGQAEPPLSPEEQQAVEAAHNSALAE